jgi:TonB family protein
MRILISAIVLAAHAFAQTGPLARPIYRIGNGVSQPKLIYKIEPAYSEEARQAKWQGNVGLSLVVDEDGSPSEIKVSRSLGRGLDENAIDAVKQWRFQPGLKDGKPVRVIANIEVNFRLVDNPVGGPPTPEALAAAEAVIAEMNTDLTAQQVMSQFRAQTMQQIKTALEDQLPKTLDRASIASDLQSFERELADRYATRFLSGDKGLLVKTYAETFTLQELHDLEAFFRTPAGQAFTNKMPDLVRRNAAAAVPLAVQIGNELQIMIRDWLEAMKKKAVQ